MKYGTTMTAAYTYDAYGSPLTESINYGDNILQSSSNTYYNNANNNSVTPYILGALTDRTVTASRSGTPSSSKRVLISVHEYGLPKTKITYANGNKTSETSYTYNTKGNVLTESTDRKSVV